MKIGIIIPDRQDRDRFLTNCLRQLRNQTLQPAEIALINHAPLTGHTDLTARYRQGYDQLRGKNLDVIALWENDEWYAPEYLETQVTAWNHAGRPDLFGTTYTIYYHMGIFAYYRFDHHTRSAAMSTLIRPDLNFQWPPDYEVFTDSHLYQTLPYKLWEPPYHICLGMKHGVGLTGGKYHKTEMERYRPEKKGVLDHDKRFMRGVMRDDPEGFDFFANYFETGTIPPPPTSA